ncbi:MAG: ATP synthase F1 subunit gamma [Rickettsiales bacterium]|nr:ATP synthase F1 subunit gamma [Rickettsiales bacterium]|tara:strand:- start:55083 stop:55961 length:879 start_codon:yes stop_codon:yes gene_type:complete
MASLKTLKKRIQSVQSTRKITSAMRMVATSYYRRYQTQIAPIRRMNSELTAALKTAYVVNSLEGYIDPFVASSAPVKNHLLLVIGTDRGLCGSFNIKLLNNAQGKVDQLIDMGQNVSVLCVGHRLSSMTSMINQAQAVKGHEIDYKNVAGFAASFISHLRKLRRENLIQACTVIYGSHESAISFTPKAMSLLPIFSEQDFENKEDIIDPLFESEPDPSCFMESLAPEVARSLLQQAIIESKASEESTRMVAMENATKNAEEMIRKLNIEFNRNRQASITKELIEIISGAEAV